MVSLLHCMIHYFSVNCWFVKTMWQTSMWYYKVDYVVSYSSLQVQGRLMFGEHLWEQQSHKRSHSPGSSSPDSVCQIASLADLVFAAHMGDSKLLTLLWLVGLGDHPLCNFDVKYIIYLMYLSTIVVIRACQKFGVPLCIL